MNWTAVLVPFGILNTQTDQLSIYFGQSAETSDFIVDCLAHWCRNNQDQLVGLDELVIDLDGVGVAGVTENSFVDFLRTKTQT